MLLDTSGLLCVHHRGELQHRDAQTLFRAAPLRLTHSYVLAEFIALAQVRRLDRAAALAFVAELQDNPLVQVIWVDRGEPAASRRASARAVRRVSRRLQPEHRTSLRLLSFYARLSIEKSTTARQSDGVPARRTPSSLILYHLVWTPKRRKAVLKDAIAVDCRRLIEQKCAERGWEIVELAIQPDHIHLFVRVWPSVAAADVVKEVKGLTAHELREPYAVLRKLPSLWTRS